MPGPVFRKGLDLKHVVAGDLARDYHSQLIEDIRASDFEYRSGRVTIHLAQEFGFCYGVDRAVDYAYQTRRKFPDRTVYLTGEIIHNPHVNARLRSAGIRFLSDSEECIEQVTSNDVVILPAFGATVRELDQLTQCGCTLVDTTCGSVLNVWKNVRHYAHDGFTALIHGKVKHEETQATASQARLTNSGRYLIVLDGDEAALVCDYIAGRESSADLFHERFASACSPGFDPKLHLQRVGLANQTTMLMSESLKIGEMVQQAMVERYGEASLGKHYRAFDTICSATQDRQDAARSLFARSILDLAIVIGGYNSSNTRNLARICEEQVPTYHIAEPACLVSAASLRYLPTVGPLPQPETTATGWLPATNPLTIGVTAGASTPDNIVGQVIARLVDLSE